MIDLVKAENEINAATEGEAKALAIGWIAVVNELVDTGQIDVLGHEAGDILTKIETAASAWFDLQG